MAARGNGRRALALLGTGLLLTLGGTGAFLGVRYQIDQRIQERRQMEAVTAAHPDAELPPGPTSQLLAKERRVIPHLMHIFTAIGVMFLVMGLGEHRGWKRVSPVWEPPAEEKPQPSHDRS